MKQMKDDEIRQNLHKKFAVFISDKNILINKLNCKEIYSLAKIFIQHFIKKVYNTKQTKQLFLLNLFLKNKLVEALLNPTKKLFLSNDRKFLVENTSNDSCVLYINPIDDNYLDFQLKLIFYSCDIMKRKGDIILHFKFNDRYSESFFDSIRTIQCSLKLNLPLITISFYNIHRCDFVPNAFARALNQNITLLELNLVCGYLCKNIKLLAKVLQKNRTLTKLNLSDNFIQNKTESIAYTLQNNTTLLELDLSSNEIGYKGIKLLAMKGLEKNITLKTLNLNNNLIGSFAIEDSRHCGVQWLAGFLRTRNTLTTLNLDSNDISCSGANKLAYALRNNTTLLKLSLVDNIIGLDGAMAFLKALRINNTLKLIDLSDNYFNNIHAEWEQIYYKLRDLKIDYGIDTSRFIY